MIDNRACPHCGSAHETQTSLGERGQNPKAGDVNICIDCGEISLFGPNLELRAASELELAAMRQSEAWPTIDKYSRLFKEAKAQGCCATIVDLRPDPKKP